MRVAAQNREKFTKSLNLGVQGHLRLSMFTFLKELVDSACYDKQHVCAYLQLFSR